MIIVLYRILWLEMCFVWIGHHRDLHVLTHSFPTRRSSDLTGANRGIGLEFVRSFAGDGWRVHACARNIERAQELRAVAGDVVHHRLDVADGLKAAGLARTLADEAIDVLINKAGVYGPHSGFGQTEHDAGAEVGRQSGGEGRRVEVRVDCGGGLRITKK